MNGNVVSSNLCEKQNRALIFSLSCEVQAVFHCILNHTNKI